MYNKNNKIIYYNETITTEQFKDRLEYLNKCIPSFTKHVYISFNAIVELKQKEYTNRGLIPNFEITFNLDFNANTCTAKIEELKLTFLTENKNIKQLLFFKGNFYNIKHNNMSW